MPKTEEEQIAELERSIEYEEAMYQTCLDYPTDTEQFRQALVDNRNRIDDMHRKLAELKAPSQPPTTDNQPNVNTKRGQTGHLQSAAVNTSADTQASELERILDQHAVTYARTTKRFITGELTETERDAHWSEQDLASKAALSALLREATPDFMKPGAIIPYETINGKEWVSLDWLTAQLRKQSKKGGDDARS